MVNVKDFWNKVANRVKELADRNPSGFLFVTSEDNPGANVTGGSVSEVTVARAAQLIETRSHRIATEDEVAKFEAQAQQNLRTSRAAELQANRQDPVSIGAALLVAMRQAELTADPSGPVRPPVTGKK